MLKLVTRAEECVYSLTNARHETPGRDLDHREALIHAMRG